MSAKRRRSRSKAISGVQRQLPLSVSIEKGEKTRTRSKDRASHSPMAATRSERPVSEVLSILPMDQILSTTDVEQITRRHRTTLFRWMACGRFPRKVVHEGLPVGWRRSDVERWLRGVPSVTGLGDSRLR